MRSVLAVLTLAPTVLALAATAYRLTPTCGPRVTIHIRGKEERGFLADGHDEYVKRLRPTLQLTTVWHKTDSDMEAAVFREQCPVICMDERGKQLDSTSFSEYLYKKLEIGGSRLAFVIGGAEGLPASMKAEKSYDKMSLSKMVLTHTWAWALLSEQIYRATEIRKGTKYHKA
ncbi:Alpha/beta knot methyltransferase [Tribonema minus]|uniref:Alpha/beta knot methyltransferase n=1 Tax=Tribonema minus TaxID=303371 RepID=A0A835ZC53_9STRA|nr:Alpha/beta knot methyltransferase [Tribonema minus]